ncbi:phosphonate transporter [Sphingomonas sp. PB2P19]|uniref:phosphonate transporter n=1 Tax=Sphingomonas rhamnosi TaxID=3096156 RepID=UPI002FC67824
MTALETGFDAVTLRTLDMMGEAERDALPYGVVGLAADMTVESYNATEARMAGLDPASVIGVPFFDAIAQCMNNFMVAQRFEDEPELDALVPYVLTLRMRPTKVRLRLLASATAARRYILIQR